LSSLTEKKGKRKTANWSLVIREKGGNGLE